MVQARLIIQWFWDKATCTKGLLAYRRDSLGKSANETGPKRLFGKWDILQTCKTLSNNLSSYRAQVAILQEKLLKFQ